MTKDHPRIGGKSVPGNQEITDDQLQRLITRYAEKVRVFAIDLLKENGHVEDISNILSNRSQHQLEELYKIQNEIKGRWSILNASSPKSDSISREQVHAAIEQALATPSAQQQIS